MSPLVHLMSSKPTTVERAYELAREGKGIQEIGNVLRAEGYSNVVSQLLSPTLRADLRRIARQALADKGS